MVDKVKSYNIDGVAANVQLGSKGPSFIGSDSSKIRFEDNAGNLAEASISNATIGSHAVTLQQLRAQAKNKLRNDQFIVRYNDVTKNLAVAQPNTYITGVCVEASAVWTGADSNTNITVGDSGDQSRLFSGFDPDAQSLDETDYEYANATTLTAYITPGGASAGNAIITVWYFGELTNAADLVTSNLTLNLDAGDISSYSGSGSTWTDIAGTPANITLVGSPTYTSGTPAYFSFNGSNQYGTGSVAGVLGTTAYTKSVWFRISSYTDNNLVSSGTGGHFMFMGNNPSVDRKIYCGHADWGSYIDYGSTGTINLNTWYNATLTFSTTNGMTLYINGVLDSTYTANKSALPGNGSTNIATYNTGNLLNGDIGKVLCYDKELTAAEVLQNFNAFKGNFGL